MPDVGHADDKAHFWAPAFFVNRRLSITDLWALKATLCLSHLLASVRANFGANFRAWKSLPFLRVLAMIIIIIEAFDILHNVFFSRIAVVHLV